MYTNQIINSPVFDKVLKWFCVGVSGGSRPALLVLDEDTLTRGDPGRKVHLITNTHLSGVDMSTGLYWDLCYLTSKAVRRNFFLGGGGGARLSANAIFEGKRKRGREAPERREGAGGGVPPPTRGSCCIFEIEIERSGAHFGWIFGGNL